MANRKPIRSIGKDQPRRRPKPPVERSAPGFMEEPLNVWNPEPIASIEDTGLGKLALSELVLKVLYYGGEMRGRDIAGEIKLPFAGVIEESIAFINREHMVEITGQRGIGEAGFTYTLTSAGLERALEAIQKTGYSGAAPVSLDAYLESVAAQNRNKMVIQENDMRKVMENLIVDKSMLDKIGPAANSGTSIFLYGPPGNGKTTLSEAIGKVILGDDMWVPYAIDVNGQIIKIYDDVNHKLSDDQTPVDHGSGRFPDTRWVRVKRPIIIVGGELTMESLDLIYDPVNKFYEAPYQVKANGGMFLIDDFGRQQVSPLDLLNRWIVPLEKKYDFLTLNNGQKIEMPFKVLIIFSTNMDPQDLVDDAFLRRIKYKIEVGNPTLEQFRELFELMCRITKVPYDERGLAYLIKEWYHKYSRPYRFVHPRDLLSQMQDIAAYMGVDVTMSNRELIDRAAESYFVEL